MSELVKFQLGKNGLTENFSETVAKTFKNHELVKISVLKSCSRNREETKDIAADLCKKLEKAHKKRFTSRIVGYTIFIRKWRH
jgi:RNA-binding protein YhbY